MSTAEGKGPCPMVPTPVHLVFGVDCPSDQDQDFTQRQSKRASSPPRLHLHSLLNSSNNNLHFTSALFLDLTKQHIYNPLIHIDASRSFQSSHPSPAVAFVNACHRRYRLRYGIRLNPITTPSIHRHKHHPPQNRAVPPRAKLNATTATSKS